MRPKLIYVTPSHQCPLGVVMSVSRRLELLEFAAKKQAWILEDDYDSEYRYFTRPVAALQSLDRRGRVIYIGTFSKTLVPALRIGYLIVPKPLVAVFSRARRAMDRQPAVIDQAVLAEFISEGWLERHIRQTRIRYLERQKALLTAIRVELPDILEASPGDAGLYLVAYIKNHLTSGRAARMAASHGVDVIPLSACSLGPLAREGLVLGYGEFTVEQIRESIQRLSKALRRGKRECSEMSSDFAAGRIRIR
jgi:GntR family transcriptional regulator / MocR family aminotransferase